MRKLNTGDVFKMARILKQGDVVDIIRKAYEDGRKEGADAEAMGMDVALGILCSCTNAGIENQFYELMSGICEKKPEDIQNQSLESTVEDITRIFRENNVANFLKSAAKLSEKTSG